MDMDKFLLH